MIELTDEQYKIVQAAKKWFFSSGSQLFEFEGQAGTGKSVTIFYILKELGLTADQYMPMAYTGQAAIVMRTKGFPNARSIHSWLYELIEVKDEDDGDEKYGRPKKKFKFVKKRFLEPNIRLFFIDEAYMVPDYMKRDIMSFHIKIIATGDSRQLPPIGGRPAFLKSPNCMHLTRLMRQSLDDPIIYLAQRILNGDPIHCGMYGNSVMVIEDSDFSPEMFYYADIVLTGTNRTRDIMNQYVRYLKGINDFRLPLIGERVICRNNNWNITLDGISLANGLIGTVIETSDISEVDKYRGTFHMSFITDVLGIDFDGLDINLLYFLSDFQKRSEMRDFSSKVFVQGELFEFAYAITTHLSQGSEHNKGIIIQEYLRPQMQKQLDYTAITRFKQSAIIVKKTGRQLYLPM